MKLVKTSLLLYVLIALVACTKEATKYNNNRPADEVKILSFGFYKEDNEGLILKDYVVKNIQNTTIGVPLPDYVDKTKLVARFTTSNNSIVKVDGVLQKSGETINDFTIPKDYILTVDKTNSKYTIIIAPDFIWQKIPFAMKDSANALALKANPITLDPFFLYVQSRSSTADQKAAMTAYENGQWNDKGEISDARAGNMDFTFNSQGTPYVSYQDYTASVAQAHTVKKYNGNSNWEYVGNRGVTTVRGTFNALAFSTDSKLLLFSYLDAAGVLLRRELGISTFENNTWITNGTIPGRASTLYGYLPVAKKMKDAIYLGVMNASSPNSVSIYKYANNTWTTLVAQWRDASATAINTRDFDIAVDSSGNVYAAFADNSSNSLYKYRVIKYNAVNGTVTNVGDYINGASGNLFSFDLEVSPSGAPYLFYRNSSNFPTIVYLDSESQNWTIPFIFETEVGDELNLDFIATGEAYAAYIKNKKIVVHKYIKQ